MQLVLTVEWESRLTLHVSRLTPHARNNSFCSLFSPLFSPGHQIGCWLCTLGNLFFGWGVHLLTPRAPDPVLGAAPSLKHDALSRSDAARCMCRPT